MESTFQEEKKLVKPMCVVRMDFIRRVTFFQVSFFLSFSPQSGRSQSRFLETHRTTITFNRFCLNSAADLVRNRKLFQKDKTHHREIAQPNFFSLRKKITFKQVNSSVSGWMRILNNKVGGFGFTSQW